MSRHIFMVGLERVRCMGGRLCTGKVYKVEAGLLRLRVKGFFFCRMGEGMVPMGRDFHIF